MEAALPIIFITALDITALDDEVLEDAAARAGCIAFLRKPFSAERLIAAVTSVLSG